MVVEVGAHAAADLAAPKGVGQVPVRPLGLAEAPVQGRAMRARPLGVRAGHAAPRGGEVVLHRDRERGGGGEGQAGAAVQAALEHLPQGRVAGIATQVVVTSAHAEPGEAVREPRVPGDPGLSGQALVGATVPADPREIEPREPHRGEIAGEHALLGPRGGQHRRGGGQAPFEESRGEHRGDGRRPVGAGEAEHPVRETERAVRRAGLIGPPDVGEVAEPELRDDVQLLADPGRVIELVVLHPVLAGQDRIPPRPVGIEHLHALLDVLVLHLELAGERLRASPPDRQERKCHQRPRANPAHRASGRISAHSSPRRTRCRGRWVSRCPRSRSRCRR